MQNQFFISHSLSEVNPSFISFDRGQLITAHTVDDILDLFWILIRPMNLPQQVNECRIQASANCNNIIYLYNSYLYELYAYFLN